MTATSMLPDKPPSRVRHGWRCTRQGPIVETTKHDANDVVHIVSQGLECGGTDLVDRLREAGGVTR